MTIEEESSFRLFVDGQSTMTNQEWSGFVAIWKKVIIPRKETISKIGDTEKYIYFILEGSQRVYFTDFEQKEATLVFTYPFSLGGNVDSFLLQQPSKYCYEALTKSTLLKASHSDLLEFRQNSVHINSFLESATHFALAGLLERMVELQCFSSTEKLKSLLKRSPHILQLIPNKYLANYIGVDPTNFSKIINSVHL